MKAAREDRLESSKVSGGFPVRHVLLVLAIIAVGVVLWQTISEQAEQPAPAPVVVEEVAIQPPPLPPAEDIPPRPEPVVAEEAPEVVEQAPALPSLADSDAMMRNELAAAGAGPELERLVQQQNLIQQGTALIDGFSRGQVLRKLLPVDPPKAPFTALERDGQLFMDPAGYGRYDVYAEAIAALDAAVLIDNFHTMRPLYEQAYAQLGLDPEEFDNAVIRVLDRIIATPELDEPVELTRESVMYQYADPQLEQLVPLQKQLLRMGPDNVRRIKQQAQKVRAGLLNQ